MEEKSPDVPELLQEQQNSRGPPNGTLILCGGSIKSKEIWDIIRNEAGGKDVNIVYIPTAAPPKKIHKKKMVRRLRKKTGWKGSKIKTVHTIDRKKADTDEFVTPINEAKLLFIGGGKHWRLADVYRDTKTHKAMHNLLDRGGVVAGQSAGCAIQGDLLCRGDNLDPDRIVGDHLKGFKFVQNIAIDQHVEKNERENDLIEFVEAFPHILGIGIEQDTGVIFKKNIFEVIGTGKVYITDNTIWPYINSRKQQKQSHINKLGRPLSQHKYFTLIAGDRYNVKTRKILEQGTIWDDCLYARAKQEVLDDETLSDSSADEGFC